MPYLELDLTGDFDSLANIGQNYLRTQIPGWEPRPGNVETILIEAVAQMLAEVIDQVSLVPPAVFAEMGETIFGIPIRPAVSAVSTSTFTLEANAPAMTIEQGTQITVEAPSGDALVFVTTRDEPITSEATAQDVLIPVEALVGGEAGNGAHGDSDLGTANLVTDIAGVTRVVVPTAQGGAEEEDQEEYLDRLSDLLVIMAPRAVTARDFGIVGRQVPGVGRVLVLDLYIPPAGLFATNPPTAIGDSEAATAAAQTNVPRATTLAVTAEGGQPPDQALLQRVYDAMVAAREVNTLSYAMAPTYTTIDVSGVVVAYPGYDPGTVADAAEASVAEWLSPATFGQDPSAREPVWALNTAARLYEAVDYANRALGVHYVESIQIGVQGGALGTDDVPLTGDAPLPLAGDINFTGKAPDASA